MQSNSYMCNTELCYNTIKLCIEVIMSESITLDNICQKLKQIDDKLNQLIQEKTTSSLDPNMLDSLDVMTLLSLPDHLRTSAFTLFELKEATADEVSEITNKERAVESNYLNQLVRMGHVDKFRNGRKVYFRINDEKSGINI